MKTWMIGLLSFAFGINVYATQEFNPSKNQRIQATISNKELNRIAFEQDRIQQVYGNEGFGLEQDKLQGQIFIKALGEGPIYISLVTEKGYTQDITLTPKVIAPQTIIIKPLHGSHQNEKHKNYLKKNKYEESIERFLKTMMAGRPMEGMEIISDWKVVRTLPKGLESDGAKAYKGQVIVGEVITIKNNQEVSISITEAEFNKPRDRAIALSKQVLKPGEKGTVYIIRTIGGIYA